MNEKYVLILRDAEGLLHVLIKNDPLDYEIPTVKEARDTIADQMEKYKNPTPVSFSKDIALRYKEAVDLIDILDHRSDTEGHYIFVKGKNDNIVLFRS